jgi:4-amino-4-deoxy-L-arabinose transferase-like glycosyltransferase
MQSSQLNLRNQTNSGARRWLGVLFEALLIVLIGIGILFRFDWVNWSQGANLHPDEYGLTSTLTQLSVPKSLGDYFNTRISPLSPYNKYDINGQKLRDGPDNRMRWGQWPITILRTMGELTGLTGYNEIRLMGRSLSALADTLSLLLIFLIGRRLYNFRIGLLAAALSSLAVMQIQQSHFMTVDNFAVFFTCATLYCAVRIAQTPPLFRPTPTPTITSPSYQPGWQAAFWYAGFGVAFGMALASKVNLAPLGGLVLIAAFIGAADMRLRSQRDLLRIVAGVVAFLLLAVVATLVTFRITQPMTFRAKTGDTTILTVHLNQDWVDSMQVAQNESNGIGGGPPSEQWAHRLAIIFPLENMVIWGMGLPLGIAVWAGFLWAAWRAFRHGSGWRSHLIPLVWTGGYFLFMGTRWVKSVRYFLPIYAFLCLLAAWALVELWVRAQRASESAAQPARRRKPFLGGHTVAVLSTTIVLLGTLTWAYGFVKAVYLTNNTRVQATLWIMQNIPAPFQVTIDTPQGPVNAQVGAPSDFIISLGSPVAMQFTAPASGTLQKVTIPHLTSMLDGKPVALNVQITGDLNGGNPLDVAVVQASHASTGSGNLAQADFKHAAVEQDATYYLIASVQSGNMVRISRSVVSNESWDEGLPFPFLGRDPFGEMYTGLTMEVRWYDDANKKQMFLDTLAKTDYIILPSQRAIWSVPRIPLTYPMTMEYYRALFDGSLGFDQVAAFQSPLQFGPLEISDVGGTLAWNKKPALPLFNNNLLAAEEAFSIYDHPPVWIFKKRPDFSLANAAKILNSIDLSKVIIQSPRDTEKLPAFSPIQFVCDLVPANRPISWCQNYR